MNHRGHRQHRLGLRPPVATSEEEEEATSRIIAVSSSPPPPPLQSSVIAAAAPLLVAEQPQEEEEEEEETAGAAVEEETTNMSSGSSNCSSKSVRFSPITRISYVPHLSEVDRRTLDETYNTPRDARRIEEGMIESIRAYRAGKLLAVAPPPLLNDDEEEDTVRGLEHLCSASELRRRKVIKERAAEVVLQDGEGDNNGSKEERLARAYAAASAEARDIALRNGRDDAVYVRLHVKPRVPAGAPRRPILKKERSVTRDVLARLTAASAIDCVNEQRSPPQQPEQQQQQEGRADDLVGMLDRALDINAPSSSSMQQQQQQQGRSSSSRVPSSSSRGSSLWASLSREAIYTASTVVAGGAEEAPPPPPPPGGAGAAAPPKLARDVLERISLALREEKEGVAPLPVAVAVPLPSSSPPPSPSTMPQSGSGSGGGGSSSSPQQSLMGILAQVHHME